MGCGVAEVSLLERFEGRLPQKLSLIGLVMMAIGAPTSSSLFGLGSLLLVFCLLSPAIWRALRMYWPQFMAGELLGLVALQLLAFLWAIAPLNDALDTWFRYSKLLLIPVVGLVIATAPRVRSVIWGVFIGHGLLLALVYGNYFLDIPWAISAGGSLFTDHSIFTDYIAETCSHVFFFIAVIAMAKHAQSDPRMAPASQYRSLICCVVAGLIAFGVLALTQGRGGQVAFFAVALAVGYQWLGREIGLRANTFALSAGAVFIAAVVFFVLNPNMQRGFHELMSYEGHDVSGTSWGIRVGLVEVAWKAFTAQPWFGYGTGSWHVLADGAYNNSVILEVARVFPNNQLAHFSVELGLLGALWFVIFLVRFYLLTIHSQQVHAVKLFSVGVLLLFVLDSIFHAAWFRSGERETFILAFGLALGFAARPLIVDRRRNSDD